MHRHEKKINGICQHIKLFVKIILNYCILSNCYKESVSSSLLQHWKRDHNVREQTLSTT